MGVKQQAENKRVGMWSTISDAVHEGWGATARLLVILFALGVPTSLSTAVVAVVLKQ
jgi:hypothetical protein